MTKACVISRTTASTSFEGNTAGTVVKPSVFTPCKMRKYDFSAPRTIYLDPRNWSFLCPFVRVKQLRLLGAKQVLHGHVVSDVLGWNSRRLCQNLPNINGDFVAGPEAGFVTIRRDPSQAAGGL